MKFSEYCDGFFACQRAVECITKLTENSAISDVSQPNHLYSSIQDLRRDVLEETTTDLEKWSGETLRETLSSTTCGAPSHVLYEFRNAFAECVHSLTTFESGQNNLNRAQNSVEEDDSSDSKFSFDWTCLADVCPGVDKDPEYLLNGIFYHSASFDQLNTPVVSEHVSEPVEATDIPGKDIAASESVEKRDFIRLTLRESDKETCESSGISIENAEIELNNPPTNLTSDPGTFLPKNNPRIPTDIPALRRTEKRINFDDKRSKKEPISSASSEANDPPSRPQSGFQTAAEALVETQALRRGVNQHNAGQRRLGLSRLAYNPPFAKSDSPNPDVYPVTEAGNITDPSALPGTKTSSHDETENTELSRLPPDLLLPDGSGLHPRLTGCDPNLVLTITHEVMDSTPQVTWDDIAGLCDAKQLMEEIIVWPMLRPDIFTGLRGPPKGVLLFGPPGTGKTMLAKAVASQTGCTFFNISSSSLMSKWVGEGEKLVRCLFAVAAVRQPSVVFIDEIDSLLSSRAEGEMDAVRRVKTEFLVQLDGAATDTGEKVLIVGATNRPAELDEAARRRLERRIYIALPDKDSRSQLILRLLRHNSHDLSVEDLTQVVEQTQGYSGADLKTLCREAAMYPLRDCGRLGLCELSVEQVRPITREDFHKACRVIRPTVSAEEVGRYRDWDRIYGCCSLAESGATPESEEKT